MDKTALICLTHPLPDLDYLIYHCCLPLLQILTDYLLTSCYLQFLVSSLPSSASHSLSLGLSATFTHPFYSLTHTSPHSPSSFLLTHSPCLTLPQPGCPTHPFSMSLMCLGLRPLRLGWVWPSTSSMGLGGGPVYSSTKLYGSPSLPGGPPSCPGWAPIPVAAMCPPIW